MKRGPAATAVLLLLALALFSLLFSLAAENDLWPRLPAGALHDTDLWAGLGAGVALLLLLIVGHKARSGTVNGAGRSDRAGDDSG